MLSFAGQAMSVSTSCISFAFGLMMYSTADRHRCILTQCRVLQATGMGDIDAYSSETEDDLPDAKKAKHSSE